MSSPLQGEPERQAIAPIGGFLYQIWQSVLSWIKLEASEVLYLEGAEDFDVIGHGQATAVQVRHTAALITLGSAKTIKVIEQYWKLREMNSGKKVAFRYLTTSQPGIEAGSPFGQDVSGIDFWERCRKRCEEIVQAVQFSPRETFLRLKAVHAEEVCRSAEQLRQISQATGLELWVIGFEFSAIVCRFSLVVRHFESNRHP